MYLIKVNSLKDLLILIFRFLKNVMKGLNYKKVPYSQEKFFTILKSEINLYCVNTINYFNNLCFKMIPENGLSLYIPKGWGTVYTPLIKKFEYQNNMIKIYH